ncbi:hypothetical protein HYW76_05215 [Candidatus Pacearchaeota archaeon]|nr:hypothetical protein [Candidatus Pacearchaeota archaeon]
MTEGESGKIVVSGLNADSAEKAILENLIKNYKSKISEKIKFEEITISIKKSAHGKAFLHQIKGRMIAGKIFNAEASDYNLFAAVAEVFEKMMNEAEHYHRTRRQTR